MMHARSNTLAAVVVTALLLVLSHAAAAAGDPGEAQRQERPAPAPTWVRGSVDHGAAAGADAALKGLITPEGFRLDVVAREPVVIDPLHLTFGDDGTPYVIEWKKPPGGGGDPVIGDDAEIDFKDGTRRKMFRFDKRAGTRTDPADDDDAGDKSIDWLKSLHDKDGDGVYDAHSIVIDDLQMPAACLIHDGWFYFTTRGSVIRRRQSEPGGKFDISETIVRGLPAFGRHQASGLTMSHDGWLFITAGDDDCHAEGSDGSRVDLLRTGGVFMCRPDGSKLHLYASGFSNPYGGVVFDQHRNMFHVDGLVPGPAEFKDDERMAAAIATWRGTRLMHVLEGADFGWRLEPGYRCCVPDVERAALSGQRPGTSPVMTKTDKGAPAGLLCFTGHALPEVLRGWLIQPDPLRHSVTAYRVQRDNAARGSSSFEVAEQFVLMKGDEHFRPSQAVQGPDGAIYIVDSRSDMTGPLTFYGEGKAGRIYRLTWAGTTEQPALASGLTSNWARVGAMSNVQLWQELNTTDLEMQKRVVNELERRGARNKETFIAVAKDEKRPAHARTAALGAVCRMAGADEIGKVAAFLQDDRVDEVRRLAASAMQRHSPERRLPATSVERPSESPAKDSKFERSRALAQVMLDAKRPIEERRVALRSLGRLKAIDHFAAIQPVEQGVERVTRELAELAADPTADELRGEALKLLMDVDPKRAEAQAIRLLNSGEPASVAAALERISGAPAGAAMLGNWFAEGKLDRTMLPAVVATLRKHAEAQAKAGEAKEIGETKALLVKVYRAGLLAETDEESMKQLEAMVRSQGDAERGKTLFKNEERMACVQCHTTDAVRPGDLVREPLKRAIPGPDLSRSGKTLPMAALIEAVIEPSKEIKENFRAWTLTMNEGRVLTGIKIEENDQSVTFRDAAKGQDLLILRRAIASLKEKKESLMPDDYVLRLSYEDLIDLLAFLGD